MPELRDDKDLTLDLATGYQGSREKNGSFVQKKNKILFSTTASLLPKQGFTIAIGMPKGIIQESTIFDSIYFFLEDNLAVFWLLFLFLFVLFFYIHNYRLLKKEEKKNIVIPLFHPPQELQPCQIRYIMHKEFDQVAFASELVNMGVHGLLEISKENNHYVLKKIKDGIPYSKESTLLYNALPEDKKFYIKQNAQVLKKVFDHCRACCQINFNSLFDKHLSYLFFGVVLSIGGCGLVPLLHYITADDMWFFFFLGAFALVHIVFNFLFSGYTNAGNKLVAQIKGFKLYLQTAEVPRFEIVGTPPVKTPELYERYLPYAIALEVEQQWTAQFATVFQELAVQGKPYQPSGWFIYNNGMLLHDFNSLIFINQLQNEVQSVIVSSEKVPGRSSVFGDKGGFGGGGTSSGGGSGGGGGGGW